MTLAEAINASQIAAARGYDSNNKCVVSIAYYGGQYMWMTGWGGAWTNEWQPVKSDEMVKLEGLDFRPTGPRPVDDIEDVMVEIYKAIEEEDDVEAGDNTGDA